ncbi:MAG: protein kinase domain-containing protein [Thermoguttaceae bacterium]
MSTLICPSRDDLLAFAAGRLPDETSELIAAHLDLCADCQAGLLTLDDADDTFVARLRQPPAADPFLEESQCRVAVARARAAMETTGAAPAIPSGRSICGRILGEYELIEELGHGGMGTVYKALHTKLDRVVALKVLTTGRTQDPRAIARFEREMKAIGKLDHHQIVRAYDAREIDSTPVLVMEYIEGLDLAEIVRRLGAVSVRDACAMARQAALGLQYVHEHGLVHRDVKPSNLMLTPQGVVKILDLGLARFHLDQSPPEKTTGTGQTVGSEMTGADQAMGTADYMAPEQTSNSRAADIRADIDSLGCTRYKL